MKTKKNILITGCAGFIGSNLAETLLSRNYSVVGLDDFCVGCEENMTEFRQHPCFTFHKGDARDVETVTRLAKGMDWIVHLAAFKIPLYESALKTLEINTKGTEACLKAAREVEAKVLFASSSDVYGKNQKMPFTEEEDLVIGSPLVKRWSYAASKIFDEQLCFAYIEEYGVPVVILRYFNSYGPRQPWRTDGKIRCGPQSLFIEAVLRSKEMIIYGDGSQKRCFTYIDDAVRGTILAMESEKSCGQIFNIGNDKTEISILDLARLIKRLSGTSGELKVRFVSHKEHFGKFEDVERRIPNLTKARTILGYEPEIGNEEGHLKTIQWLKRRLL